MMDKFDNIIRLYEAVIADDTVANTDNLLQAMLRDFPTVADPRDTHVMLGQPLPTTVGLKALLQLMDQTHLVPLQVARMLMQSGYLRHIHQLPRYHHWANHYRSAMSDAPINISVWFQ